MQNDIQNDLANSIEIRTIYSNHVKKNLPIKLRGIDKRLSKLKKTSTRRKTKESLITEIKDIYSSIIDLTFISLKDPINVKKRFLNISFNNKKKNKKKEEECS